MCCLSPLEKFLSPCHGQWLGWEPVILLASSPSPSPCNGRGAKVRPAEAPVFSSGHIWDRASIVWVGFEWRMNVSQTLRLTWTLASWSQGWREGEMLQPALLAKILSSTLGAQGEGLLCIWPHLPRGKPPSVWAGEVEVREWVMDQTPHTLADLTEISTCSWINTSSLAVCFQDNCQRL